MKNRLLFILIALPVLAFGQDSISYVPLTTMPRPVVVDQGVVLKLAPLSLIDLDPTIQVAVEIPLRPQWSIQQEIGYGGAKLGLFNYQPGLATKAKNTFRARTEIRYYFSPGYRHQVGLKLGPAGFYMAGEGLYKQMNHARTQAFTTQTSVLNGVILPQPTSIINSTTTRLTRQVYGMHAKVGYQAIVGRQGKIPHFVVDVYMGVGFRIVSVRQTGGPALRGKAFDSWSFTRFEPFDGTLRKLSLAGGVKIGWLINSGKKERKK